ncbi:hypothetical protein [Helicobacter suis]|uniref:hypothetical protein n=1 Tax=Helicobacter suis TaxID=104628 RepID=UPI0013D18010|nr:hypothetical protein [Helicobacter suis]
MSRLLLVLCCTPLLFCKSLDQRITLKKDQTFSGTLQLQNFKKPLSVRWTLYKDKGLVVHLHFNQFPYQFILYKDFQRNSFRKEIFKEGQLHSTDKTPLFFLITFKNFDSKEESATLHVRASKKLLWLPN